MRSQIFEIKDLNVINESNHTTQNEKSNMFLAAMNYVTPKTMKLYNYNIVA